MAENENNQVQESSVGDSYAILLDKISTLESNLQETNKRLEDMTSFNRALLNTKQIDSNPAKQDNLADLDKRFKENLYRG